MFVPLFWPLSQKPLTKSLFFFNEIAAVLAVNFYVFNNNSFSRLAYWCWTHCRDWSRDLGFLCIRPHAPVRPYPHLHLSPRGLSPIRTSGRYTRVPGGMVILAIYFHFQIWHCHCRRYSVQSTWYSILNFLRILMSPLFKLPYLLPS